MMWLVNGFVLLKFILLLNEIFLLIICFVIVMLLFISYGVNVILIIFIYIISDDCFDVNMLCVVVSVEIIKLNLLIW